MKNLHIDLCDGIAAFHKIGIIGDSLSHGEAGWTGADGAGCFCDFPNNSWGACIARDYGIEWGDFAVGGINTRTFYTYTSPASGNAYAKLLAGGASCDAFIISLGHNDGKGYQLEGVTPMEYLGTIADADKVDNYPDTFYGNYARIVADVRKLSPKAKIFVQNMPYKSVKSLHMDEYNAAIAALAAHLGCYLLDLHKYSYLYEEGGYLLKNWRRAHLTAAGYRACATITERLVAEYMLENPGEFTDIEFILNDYGK